jgi:hypothetical protein
MLLLSAPHPVSAEITDRSNPSEDSVASHPSPEDRTSRYNKVAVFRRNGTAVAGYLTAITDDSLMVQTCDGVTAVGVDELSHVTLMRHSQAGSYGLFGAMVGVWVGYLAAYRANGNPTALFASDDDDNEWGEILAAVFFGGAGGALFALGGKAAMRDIEIVFTHNERRRDAALRRLRRLTGPAPPTSRRVHLNITAARMFTRISGPFEDRLKQAGFGEVYYSELLGPDAEQATDMNLLRKVELNLALNPSTQVGLATVWMGEPNVGAGSVYNEGSDPWELAQMYSAVGYFATARYVKSRRHSTGDGTSWFVGAGLGVVDFDYQLTVRKIDFQAGYPTTTRRLERTRLAGYLFAGVDIFLTPGHSFGFGADYVVAPSYHVPGLAEAGIGDQNVKVGNGSIGIRLGLHY